MANRQTIDRKLNEYYQLQRQHKHVGERLEKLNKDLKRDLIEYTNATPTETISYYSEDGYSAEVSFRHGAIRYDPTELEQLLIDKGLWEYAKKEVVDEDLVQQLFIEEKITDKDLREIKRTKEPSISLKVTTFGDV